MLDSLTLPEAFSGRMRAMLTVLFPFNQPKRSPKMDFLPSSLSSSSVRATTSSTLTG